ncbi:MULTISPECIES: LysR family transcriptional regulator [Bradyrhizobium]|uniref:LysR family transcriptional regulator n=2 Tax=Nitrobacteraceae TaxID=41294 RepID=UPI0027BB0941|nr:MULTISPECIES: LysR family transcriptional regulator [Bradyrhizobium]
MVMRMTDTVKSRHRLGKFAIDLQHLRFALVASDCGSLRRAAEKLSVRHSALSRAIGQLEHLVGARLFERSAAGIKPTQAALDVLRIARVILEQVDALVDTGRTCGRGEAGRLSVGICTSISTGNLRAALLDFKRRSPLVEVAPIERSRIQLMSALQNGTIDIVISPGLVRSDSKAHSLWSERILVSLPDRHVLANRMSVYWTDLRNETVLLSKRDPGRELEEMLVSKLSSAEIRPNIVYHDVSRAVISSLVSMELGLSLVMESEIGAGSSGLVYRSLRDGNGPSRIDFYAHWRLDNESPILKRFLAILEERHPSSSTAD